MAPNICGKCEENLPENGNFATCSVCDSRLHLGKCSVKLKTWNQLGSIGQGNWVCTSCRSMKKSISVTSHNESEEDTGAQDDFEVSNPAFLKSMMFKINSLLEVKGKLNSIEKSMNFMAEKYDTLVSELNKFKEENKDLKKQVEELKEREDCTRRLADEIAMEVAELNQYGRRTNLEIQGVPVYGDPRQEDVKAVLNQVAKDIGVNFVAAEIHQAHRLQARKDGKPPTIIVQFHSKTTRDSWLIRGRQARLGNLFFNENLCPQYRQLFQEVKLRAKTNNYKFVWVKGGRILVRRNEADNNIIVIQCINDLRKIK